jgi:hypothetical protein
MHEPSRRTSALDNMIDDILDGRIGLGITILPTVMLAPFLLTYLITLLRGIVAVKRTGTGKTPPNVPYAIPLLGNLFTFAFDTCHFIDVNS